MHKAFLSQVQKDKWLQINSLLNWIFSQQKLCVAGKIDSVYTWVTGKM